MKKFLVLYRAPAEAFAKAMKSTPQEQQAGMQAWMTWGGKAQASLVDMGAPLGKAMRFTPQDATPVSNDYGGYSIMQAESKEALGPVLEGHPHFMMQGGFIEVIEIMPIPGM